MFHCNYLLKYGNLRYLKNEVVVKQSIVEIYNLDILFILLVVLLFVMIVLLKGAQKLFVIGWRFLKKTVKVNLSREKVE